MKTCEMCGKKILSAEEFEEREKWDAADHKFDGGEFSGPAQDRRDEQELCRCPTPCSHGLMNWCIDCEGEERHDPD